MTLAVHFVPGLIPPEELAGGTVAVVDVLRASTTIVYALAAGATSVTPCLEVEEARQVAAHTPGAVLGGERAGLAIAGFHLGNSPAEYSRDVLSGRPLVFTSTNGTRAIRHCRQAKNVLVGAFVNLSATCAALAGLRQVHLLCAGTRGQISRDDVLFAGAVIHKLTLRPEGGGDLNDEARTALDAWRGAFPHERLPTGGELAAQLRRTQGGRDLEELGLGRDIELAAQIDRFDLVAGLDVQTWRIERG